MHFFGDTVLPVVLFVIMIGIGLSTNLKDFKSLLKYPKAAILGIISQLILLPVVALFIAWVFNYDDEVTLGLLLLSLCPSGTGSNIITKMVKGNLALSVSLTALSSIKSLITIPVFIGMYLSMMDSSIQLGELPYWELSVWVFMLTIFPTVIGIVLAAKLPAVVESTKKVMKWLLPGLLFGVFVAIMFLDESKSKDIDITIMIVPAIVFNLLSMFVSFVFVKVFRVENDQAVAIAVEGGLKNSAIGLLISSQFFNIPSIELLILAYSFISFYLTFVVGFVLKRFLG